MERLDKFPRGNSHGTGGGRAKAHDNPISITD